MTPNMAIVKLFFLSILSTFSKRDIYKGSFRRDSVWNIYAEFFFNEIFLNRGFSIGIFSVRVNYV